MPDYWDSVERTSEAMPLRLVTPPSRTFLNSSFTETPGSQRREGRPTALVHPQDAARHGVVDGGWIRIGNARGDVKLRAAISTTALPGVVVAEGVWLDGHFDRGVGINLLIGAAPVPPAGGSAFHDTAVWLEAVPAETALDAAE